MNWCCVFTAATAELRDAGNVEHFGVGDAMRTAFFEQTDFALPLDKIFGERKSKYIKLKYMTFAQLMAAREAALQREADAGESGISKERMKVQVQIQKNFAMAFSTFSLALFGVPLAIQVGRKETYANLAIALVIAMSYYFLMVVVTWVEDQPALRPGLVDLAAEPAVPVAGDRSDPPCQPPLVCCMASLSSDACC